MKKRAISLFLSVCLVLNLVVITNAAIPETLIPVGKTVGIHLETDGLMVVDFEKTNSIAQKAGIKKGDIITEINREKVENIDDLQTILKKYKNQEVTFLIHRENGDLLISMDNNEEKLGFSVRDGISGIGTVTYYNPATNTYGALGHGVNEPQAQVLLPVDKGQVFSAKVVDVQKGDVGKAGVLRGEFQVEETLGSVLSNTENGIFGHGCDVLATNNPVFVASPDEVKQGPAIILANVSGSGVQEYAVSISKVLKNAPDGRDMILEITDPNLLRATNGIVQGMSGSPILQNGKLIGAVTHVLVNDPTTGYGIFIENMLKTAEGIK